MAIRSTTAKGGLLPGPTFPRLKIGRKSRIIVLFSSYSAGTVVGSDATWPQPELEIGKHIDNWTTSGWDDYTGPITLQNTD